MTRLQKFAVVACLWVAPVATGKTAPLYPPCSEACSWEASCGTSCYDVDGQKEDATCGEYGECEGSDPCENPSPVWVTYDNSQVGSFAVNGFDYYGGNYCEWRENRRIRQMDLQACYSARQADRYFCYIGETHKMYSPYNNSCCNYWYCGGSGSACPEP